MRVLLLVLLLAAGSFAGEKWTPRVDVTCPVFVADWSKDRWVPSNERKLPGETDTEIRWHNNTTDKTIVGVKFKVTLYDAVGDAYEDYRDFTSTREMKPLDGKQQRSRWTNLLNNRDYKQADVRVVKVAFKNGTIYVPPDDTECTFGHLGKYK